MTLFGADCLFPMRTYVTLGSYPKANSTSCRVSQLAYPHGQFHRLPHSPVSQNCLQVKHNVDQVQV